MKKYEFILKDLDCAHCANKIQTELSKKQGLENVNVNFAKLKLIYETDTVKPEEVAEIIKKIEPEVEMISLEKSEKKETCRRKKICGSNRDIFSDTKIFKHVATT